MKCLDDRWRSKVGSYSVWRMVMKEAAPIRPKHRRLPVMPVVLTSASAPTIWAMHPTAAITWRGNGCIHRCAGRIPDRL